MSERNAAGEMTKRQFAETFGVSEAQLERLFQQGMPHAKKSTRNVVIPMPDGRVWYHAYLIEKGKRQAAPKDIDEAKRRKMAAEAELAELEVARARGELMTTETYALRFADACARVDARLVNLPPRLAGVVVGVESVTEALARIEPLVEEARDELRRGEDVPLAADDDLPGDDTDADEALA